MPRGHSNVHPEKTAPWNETDKTVETGIARIPLTGGATPYTTKDLPPLSLRLEEWLEIGRKMKWTRRKN